ncbi:hypothetical protein FACS1894179_03830 [Bacteroidia bacterium]|nr:hypothetical protein FACS1894179_03830 [Bacteroidia bacterium]
MLYLRIDYEIYNDILHRLAAFARIGTAGRFSKQKIGDRKMHGTGLFCIGISTDSGFTANEYQRAMRLSCDFSD